MSAKGFPVSVALLPVAPGEVWLSGETSELTRRRSAFSALGKERVEVFHCGLLEFLLEFLRAALSFTLSANAP